MAFQKKKTKLVDVPVYSSPFKKQTTRGKKKNKSKKLKQKFSFSLPFFSSLYYPFYFFFFLPETKSQNPKDAPVCDSVFPGN